MLAYPLISFTTFKQQKGISAKISLTDIQGGINKVGTLFVYKKEDFIEIFDAHCTHMGCILNIDENKNQLICPCHNSKFALDGTRIKGPATRNLDKMDFIVKNETILVG